MRIVIYLICFVLMIFISPVNMAAAAAQKTIIVGGETDYPPYCFLDKNGLPTGFQVDLTRSIARVMGMEIEINLSAWADVRKRLENGTIDIICGMFYSDERAEIYDFSPPYTIVSSVIFARRDAPSVQSIDDLRDKEIIVMRGEAMHDLVVKQKITHKLILAETPDDVLRLLAAGKGDYALGAQMPGLYWIDKLGLSNITTMGKPLEPFKNCFSVHKGNTLLLSQFTEGLLILQQTGEYQKLYQKWFGVLETPGVSLTKVFKYAAAVFLHLLVLLVVAFVWSWTLRRTVARRTLELSESRQQLLTLSDNLPNGYVYQILMDGEQRRFTYVSVGVELLHGVTASEVMVDPKLLYDQIIEEDRLLIAEQEAITQETLTHFYLEVRYRRPSGEIRWLLITSSPHRLPEQGIATDGLAIDITERKQAQEEKARLEDRFHQAQKLESIGRLAGGVAHDFNNMLMIILAYSEMALNKVDPSTPLFSDLTEIRKAANRSADLTKQLLAFARKQVISPKVIDLGVTVVGMLKMLRRLIGEDIGLSYLPGADLWPVKVAPTQVDQILANLCVNARDAIADVGKVTIETKNVTFDESYCAEHPGFFPGEFVLLAVRDSGEGIEKEMLEHIFEPFFTTKELGKGTGLGLATVYGIVKQNNGFINVYSEPGHGTSFKIYLPRHASKAMQIRKEGLTEPAAPGDETILLVDDEEAILTATTKVLERKGYTVLTASTPGEAIRLAMERVEDIHLLMTDVIMPEMNGRDLAKNILSLYPNLKCLFMSGYTANVIAHRGVLDAGVQFIQKPFSGKDLYAKIREALGK